MIFILTILLFMGSSLTEDKESICMRRDIYDLLSVIEPADPVEQEHILYAKDWILSGEGLYRITKPDIPNVHLVAYCLVIDFERNEILLGAHKDSGLWLPPGGHCDPNELPRTTAERELMEEMGMIANFYSDLPLFFSVTKTSGPSDNGHTDVGFWYVSKGDSSIKPDFDQMEFDDLKWFPINDLQLEITDPHMARFIEKINSQLR